MTTIVQSLIFKPNKVESLRDMFSNFGLKTKVILRLTLPLSFDLSSIDEFHNDEF